jgi:hypothetical protein
MLLQEFFGGFPFFSTWQLQTSLCLHKQSAKIIRGYTIQFPGIDVQEIFLCTHFYMNLCAAFVKTLISCNRIIFLDSIRKVNDGKCFCEIKNSISKKFLQINMQIKSKNEIRINYFLLRSTARFFTILCFPNRANRNPS